jgi:alkylation response protein AidB-like acyl-CoA dehydrogenase
VTVSADFAEFHDELRTVARDLLAPTSPLVSGGEPVVADWRRLAEAGWTGLEVPEDLGGAGASFAEVAVVLEELGRAATAGPFLGAVLAVGALGLVGPSPGRDALLAGIATGDALATVAVDTGDTGGADADAGANARVRGACVRVERAGGGARLVGTATFVPDATGADRLLVVADDPAAGTVLVDVSPGAAPGASTGGELDVRETPVVDPTRSLATVVADGTPVDPARCWPLAGDPALIMARGALAVAVDSVGIARAALDATVAYVADRRQFGRPVGSFQAVKHACADMAVELTISRRLVTDAVGALADAPTDASTDISEVLVAASMAKAHAVETAVTATGSALQLHGGIGYTWEHGLHAFVKRAALNRSLFGSPADHRARLARRYAA